jgi:hypothetical protein
VLEKRVDLCVLTITHSVLVQFECSKAYFKAMILIFKRLYELVCRPPIDCCRPVFIGPV